VVEHAIESQVDSLKERTIGIEVFERDPNYDTNQDPVVRSTAGEVRKRLAQYYLEVAREEEIRIGLPIGSYIPEVHAPPERMEAAPVPVLVPAPAPEAEPVQPPAAAPKRLSIWWAAAAIACVLAATGAWMTLAKSPLDRFWAPVMAPNGPLLVCVGQPKVYKFVDSTQDAVNRWVETGADRQHLPPGLPSLPVSDLVPMWNSHLALGDAMSFAMLSQLFVRYGKKVDLRGGRQVSLADLRGRPVVLIGAFNNEWTLNLSGELRFYFQHDPQTGVYSVRDRQKPGNTEWGIYNPGPFRQFPLDYAVVSRVHNQTTEHTVVTVAGISHFGTQAAGELLTNPEYFAAALKGAPSGWDRKNLQIVLSVKVLSGTAGPPVVLATHFW
jgi:hypothetical protein